MDFNSASQLPARHRLVSNDFRPTNKIFLCKTNPTSPIILGARLRGRRLFGQCYPNCLKIILWTWKNVESEEIEFVRESLVGFTPSFQRIINDGILLKKKFRRDVFKKNYWKTRSRWKTFVHRNSSRHVCQSVLTNTTIRAFQPCGHSDAFVNPSQPGVLLHNRTRPVRFRSFVRVLSVRHMARGP